MDRLSGGVRLPDRLVIFNCNSSQAASTARQRIPWRWGSPPPQRPFQRAWQIGTSSRTEVDRQRPASSRPAIPNATPPSSTGAWVRERREDASSEATSACCLAMDASTAASRAPDFARARQRGRSRGRAGVAQARIDKMRRLAPGKRADRRHRAARLPVRGAARAAMSWTTTSCKRGRLPWHTLRVAASSSSLSLDPQGLLGDGAALSVLRSMICWRRGARPWRRGASGR